MVLVGGLCVNKGVKLTGVCVVEETCSGTLGEVGVMTASPGQRDTKDPRMESVRLQLDLSKRIITGTQVGGKPYYSD